MNWIIFTTGFRQVHGRMTALEVLQNEIHKEFSNSNTRILLRSWKDDVDELADRIEASGNVEHVFLIGYSYGGYSTKLLADKLRARGIDVTVCFMIDAVWRAYKYLPSFLSLLRRWTIKLPDNVYDCVSWRQEEGKIQGHKVTAKHIDVEEIILVRGHAWMDDAPEVHRRIKHELRKYLK